MSYNKIEKKKEKYRKWLACEKTERPLIGILLEQDIPPYPPFMEKIGYGSQLLPEQFNVRDFRDAVEYIYEQTLGINEDLIQPICPAFGMPWMEAIAGCSVMVEKGSLWAEPITDFYQSDSIVFDKQNSWVQNLLEFTDALITQSDGRFPIALPQMRGPLDVLAAIRTPKQICLDLIECPDLVSRRIAEITDLWIAVAQELTAVIPSWHGGYSTRMRMFSDKPSINPQNDSMTLISPRMYRNFFEESDRKILAAFPYSSYHTHSTEYRHMDTLMSYENLTAIQLSLEHTMGGPPLHEMLTLSRKILEKKPLILVGMDLESVQIAVQELPPAGLCACVWWNEHKPIPQEYKTWVSEMSEKPYGIIN